MNSTRDIDALIQMMAKLPGLGPRSARRAVLHLIRKRELQLTPLADLMQTVAATARECLNCGNVGTTDICDICEAEKRANGMLCVVEDVADLWAMERAGVFKGLYHVLGGTLSALDQVGTGTAPHPETDRPGGKRRHHRSDPGPQRHGRWPDNGALHRRSA